MDDVEVQTSVSVPPSGGLLPGLAFRLSPRGAETHSSYTLFLATEVDRARSSWPWLTAGTIVLLLLLLLLPRTSVAPAGLAVASDLDVDAAACRNRPARCSRRALAQADVADSGRKKAD